MQAARSALLDALCNEDAYEAAAAVALAVTQAPEEGVTEEWLGKHMELVTAFKLSRGQDGATSVALMRRPRAMCHPNVVRTVDAPLEDPPACVDVISHAGVDAINAFMQDQDAELLYVVFERPQQ